MNRYYTQTEKNTQLSEIGVRPKKRVSETTDLIFTYYPDRDLRTFLRSFTTTSDQFRFDAMKSIAQMLFLLHKNGWLHRDLKPSNVLVQSTWSTHCRFMLADFEFTVPSSGCYYVNDCGTSIYRDETASISSIQTDMYALAVSCLVIWNNGS